jgi:hypothetical protein
MMELAGSSRMTEGESPAGNDDFPLLSSSQILDAYREKIEVKYVETISASDYVWPFTLVVLG